MAMLIVVALFVGIILAAYLINGWALYWLWQWFMVPFGLPAISISWAIGIAVVVGFLTNHNEPKQGEKLNTAESLCNSFLRPLLSLLIGYTAHRYMAAR